MLAAMSAEPMFIKNADGTVTLVMPVNLQPTYPVAAEMFQVWADAINALPAERVRAKEYRDARRELEAALRSNEISTNWRLLNECDATIRELRRQVQWLRKKRRNRTATFPPEGSA